MGAAAAEEAVVVVRGAPPPPSSGKRRSTTLLHLFQLEKPDVVVGAMLLPPPSPEPEEDRLITKIESCSRVFTFVDGGGAAGGESGEERDAKTEALGEVLAAVRASGKRKQGLDHRVMVALVKMVAANLFRAMPPSAYPSSLPPPSDVLDDEVPVMVLLPSWPHLHLVYDVLTAADARMLRNHVDRSFLAGLVALFASKDPRERNRLKYVYHQLYSKLTVERAFRQLTMAVALLRFVYGTSPAEPERHCGVGELLEICGGSIINGFVVPLKEEHRAFMARVLLPLHRTRWVHTCHRQLSYYGSIRRPGHLPPPLAGDQLPEGGAAYRRARGDRRDPQPAPLRQARRPCLLPDCPLRQQLQLTGGGEGAVRVEQRAVRGDGVRGGAGGDGGADPAGVRGEHGGQPGAALEQVRAAGDGQRACAA